MRPAALAGMLQAGLPLDIAIGNEQLKSDPLLELAIRVGAPLVPALHTLEQQLEASENLLEEVSQAQAIPRATRKLLLWLPALSVRLGQAIGLETVQGLLSPLGLVALFLAAGILWFGNKISGRLLQRLSPPDRTLASQLVSLDLCLSAGLGLGQIRQELGRQVKPEIERLLALSAQTGASLKPLISSELKRVQRQQLNLKLGEAKRLSVTLLIPLSLTTLPAFLLLTVAPMLIGITQ